MLFVFMKKNKCLLFLIFLLSFKGFSQNFNQTQIDSLLSVAEQLENEDLAYGVTISLKAYDDSRKIDYKKGMTQSLLIASRKQYELGKYDDVLKNASAAEKLAFSISDAKLISDAFRLKGIGLTGLGNYKEGILELKKALVFAKNLTDKEIKSSRIGVIYNDIAFNLDENGQSADSIAFYYRKGYQEFEKMVLNNPLKNKTLSLACSNVGSSFLRTKQIDSAEFYLDRALQLANSVNHEAVKASTLCDLGNLYFLKKQYTLSIDYFTKGIDVAKSINDVFVLKALYLGISKSYEEIQDDANAKKYLSEYIAIGDSLSNSEKANVLKSNQLNTGNATNFDGDNFNRIIIFSTIFFLIFIVVLIHIYRKIKKKKNSNIAEPEVVEGKPAPPYVDEAHLKRMLYLASNDDPSFLFLFRETYPDFYKKLNRINPGLIAGEQKLCAFLKLDFSTKEIAQYTNSSIRAVEAKKYRLRKKLSIPSEDDINIWMMNV